LSVGLLAGDPEQCVGLLPGRELIPLLVDPALGLRLSAAALVEGLLGQGVAEKHAEEEDEKSGQDNNDQGSGHEWSAPWAGRGNPLCGRPSSHRVWLTFVHDLVGPFA